MQAASTYFLPVFHRVHNERVEPEEAIYCAKRPHHMPHLSLPYPCEEHGRLPMEASDTSASNVATWIPNDPLSLLGKMTQLKSL